MMIRSASSRRPGCLSRRRAFPVGPVLLAVCLALAPPLAIGQAQDKSGLAKRLPVPSSADRNKTLKVLHGLYAEQYRDRSPQAQREFARSLLKVANEDGQPITRFVLYSEVLRISEALGDFPIAWQAIGRVSKQFEIDDLKIRVNLLQAVGKKNRDPELAYHIALLAQPKIEQLVANDEFLAAIELTNALESVAKRSSNKALSRDLAGSEKELERLAKRHGALQAAYATLDKNPDNMAANGSIGRFYFFEKGDYQNGVRFLAKGDDKRLAAIAGKELLAQQSSAADTDKADLAVADGWWDLAESTDDEQEQSRLRGHAVALYSGLVNRLAGIDKVRVQKRVNAQFSLSDDFFGVVWEVPWKTQDDWVGVQFRKDGKVSYTIKETREAKTVGWQATARGLLVRPSQKRYFIFKVDSQGNLAGEKYEPTQFRERVTGIRANQ